MSRLEHALTSCHFLAASVIGVEFVAGIESSVMASSKFQVLSASNKLIPLFSGASDLSKVRFTEFLPFQLIKFSAPLPPKKLLLNDIIGLRGRGRDFEADVPAIAKLELPAI